MRFLMIRTSVLTGLIAAACIAGLRPAPAAEPYCPNASHASPQHVPVELSAAIAKTLQIDEAALHSGTYVRCAGPKLMGCYVGANLDCFKADQRRKLPGATAWCRQNPDAQNIPMAATGHDTIYEWSCKGRRAVAGKPIFTVDPQGYVAENWKEIP